MKTTRLLLIAALACPLSLYADGDAPKGWRVDGSGSFPEAKAATEWSADKNVAWKTAMPDWSNASPVLVGENLYMTAEPDKLVCVRLRDGELLWSQAAADPDAAGKPRSHRANGYSTATPVTDGKHLWCVFGSGVTACFDLQGKQVWLRKIAVPNHRWGHSASPALIGGTLFVHIESTLFGLDPATGKERWKTPSAHAWGTPVPMTVGDVAVGVMANGGVIRARDGKKVAQVPARLTYSAPLIEGDIAYFFDLTVTAVKLSADGAGGVKLERLWATQLHDRRDRRTRYYASPVIHGDVLYGLEQRSTLVAINKKTGEKLYSERLSLGRGTCYPSLVATADHVLAGSDNGTTVVIAPGATYKQIATNTIGEQTRSCPVMIGNKMLYRGYKHLFCIEAGAKSAFKPASEKPASEKPASEKPAKPYKLNPKKTYY